ncbi:TPA: acyltransferase [Escherichia coli]|nr:acyltransferase [Escherichia coli]
MAAFVVFHHSGFFSEYFANNRWGTDSDLLFYIGKLGVSVFFVISAFLFWGIITKEPININWVSLYINRFFRIAPLCVACSLASVLYILYVTNYPIVNNVSAWSIIPWFDASIINVRPDINGLELSRLVMAGVTWTLKWEWWFYFSLPLLFIFRKFSMVIFTITAFALYTLPMTEENKYYSSLALYFLMGIIACEVNKRVTLTNAQSNALLVLACAAIIIFKPGLFDGSVGFFSALIVFSVAQGASLFGVLSSKGLVRLGEISYSIYLVQGLVMYPLYRFISHKFNLLDFSTYCIVTALSFICIVLTSILTYRYIEMPCYRFGKRLFKTVTQPQS